MAFRERDFHTESFVGANTHLSADLFYRLQVRPRGVLRETWDRVIAGDHRSNLTEFAELGEHGDQLIFIQSLQQIGAPVRHTLLAFINKDELNWPSAHHPDPDHRVTLLIMDGAQQVLVNLGDLELSPENLRSLSSLEEPSRYTIAGEDYMVSAMPSRALDLRYIVLTPSEIYWESSQQATMIIVVGALASLVLGFLLIIYLLRRQYSPVSDLMSYLQTQNLDLEDSPHNELDYIRGAVESALQRKNTMEERLDTQNRQLRRNVMNRLLRGDVDAEYLAQTDFPSLDLVFPYTDYTVIVIYFDRYGDDLGLAHFILRNVVEELVSAIYPCYTTKIDSLMVCVVNHPQMEAVEVENLLAPLLQQSEAVIREHLSWRHEYSCRSRCGGWRIGRMPTIWRRRA